MIENNAPDLQEIVHTWLKQSKHISRYMPHGNNVVCKCCRIIWLKILSDRVRWATLLKDNVNFEKHEVLAVDRELFDRLERVLDTAEHESK